MNELYLEWLITTCGLKRDKADRVHERYPRLEDLGDATPEAIAEFCNLSIDDARLIRQRASESLSAGDKWYSKNSSLFLCPSCGSFASADSKACPQCGASFEGAEEEGAAAPEQAEKAKEESPELYMCSNCGAFLSRDAKGCATCGQEVGAVEAAVEELPKGVVTEVEAGEVHICPECGAFLAAGARKCGICGKPLHVEKEPEEIPEVEAKESKGVSKDFLARWQRVAEKAPTREEQLQEELRHYDELIEVDPRLERAWVLKSHVLRELGRAKEATRCLEKAAQINPAREDEYRLQVLNLAETLADSSIIPPRWTAITPQEKPVAEVSAVQRALSYYERLLRADPRLDVAWETRAELLKRLGRNEEAEASLNRAKEARLGRAEGERRALEGLKTVSMPRAKTQPREGRVNGLVNGIGRTNGLVNGVGRTNGLVNGIGRTNGLVNGIGRTNGLVNGVGRTNGLVNGLGRVNGLVNGIGHVNGLVNGNGFTNGRRGRFPSTFHPDRGWFRSAGVIAAVVTVLLAAPLIASLIAPSPQYVSFNIDGDFSEWNGVPSHPDTAGDTRGTGPAVTYRPDHDLIESRIAQQDGQLVLYARVNGTFFPSPESPATYSAVDYLIAMIDTDGVRSTGYRIGDIGADLEVSIAGWGQRAMNHHVLEWRPELGGGPNNISAFRHRTDVVAASKGSELEFIVPVPEPKIARVLLLTANTTGAADISDETERVGYSTLEVGQQTLVPDIVTQDRFAFTKITLKAGAGSSTVHAINVTKTGSVADQAVGLSLYEDDGDGISGSADTLLGTSGFSNNMATFPTNMVVNNGAQVTLFVVADLTGAPETTSLKLRVSSIDSRSEVDLRDAAISGTYYRRAPLVTIDGAFGDWNQASKQLDAQWDVRSMRGASTVNENVDIAEVGLNVTSDFSFYMKVHGRMLGGEDLPNLAERPVQSTFIDTDRDTVPDTQDQFPVDFNNDGVPDDATNHDVDGDNIRDYPYGTDFWLNTTIPSFFATPYAGKIVSVYIGPLSYNVPTGVDTAFAYIDADNSSATGLYTETDGEVYGVDYALVASGRGGQLGNASLYRYRPNSDLPFVWMRSVSAAVDPSRLEIGLNASVLGLVPRFRVLAFTTDWMRDSDYVAPVLTRGGRAGIRSTAGDNVVINEIQPRKNAWVELANPTNNFILLNGWRLQQFKGNKYITIWTFTSEIMGPWLSGNEYLVADLGSNVLPTGQATIVLRNPSGVIVDETTYLGIGVGQTWSRFKAATDGKPVDTDQTNDWYNSNNPTRVAPNDRTRPIMKVVKTVNVLTAGPGDFIQYTIYYNNTGDGQAKRVWINDTLPSGVSFYSSSVPPSSSSGTTYRWTFANVQQGAQRSLTVTVLVNAGAQDSTSQVNTAFLNYTDQLDRKMESSVSWANFTCRRPVIKVEKTANPRIALPGDIITYTIYFNNTGSANALRVWINDTLPNDVTYLGASVPPSSWSGQTYRWVFTSVGPGPHSFTITVRINNPASTSVLVNWVFLNYTSAAGYKLESSSASAIVLIPEFQELAVPLMIPILVVIGGHMYRRKRKSEAVADSVPPTSGR